MRKRFISAILAVSLVGILPIYSAAASNDPPEDHEHTFACHERYDRICFENHEHTESCYEYDGDLVCGMSEGTPHVHNKDGYECELIGRIAVCGQEEHTHSTECYTEEERPFGKVELPETGFTDEFYPEEEPQAPMEESHDTELEGLPSNTIEILTCEREEHKHSGECYKEIWQCRKAKQEFREEENIVEQEEDPELPDVIPFDNDPEVDTSQEMEDPQPAPENTVSESVPTESPEENEMTPPISSKDEYVYEAPTGEYMEISSPEDWESFIPSDISIPQQMTTIKRARARSLSRDASTPNDTAMFTIKQCFLTFADYTVPMTTAYKISATLNGEVVYNDVFAITADSYDEEYISIAQGIPEGAEVTISLLYSGASYSLYTGNSDQLVWNGVQGGTNNLATFSLVYNFDNQLGYGIENHFDIDAVSLPDPPPDSGPELPETGSLGAGLMALYGNCLTGMGGLFVYMRSKSGIRRRRRL